MEKHPPHLKIAAVGAGTAKALQLAKLPVDVYPIESWSSEGLLDLPAFSALSGQTVGLFQGEGGRETLADNLVARGAKVTHFIAYRRIMPEYDVGPYVSLVLSHQIDIIVCTSGEGLHNLKKQLQKAWPTLQNVPIVVISQRMVELARHLAFRKVVMAKNASHDAIMETLRQNC